MKITAAAQDRIVNIADQAQRTDFNGLRQIAASVKPDVRIEVDPADLMGTRLDAFIADGELYVTHGDAVYHVGALDRLPELKGLSVFESAKAGDPQFVAGDSTAQARATGVLPHQTALNGLADKSPAALLAGAKQTSHLPAEWLQTATEILHNAEFEDGYYDYRVALHGAEAEKLITAGSLKGDPAFDAKHDLLLVDVYGFDEINGNVYALDVASGASRKIGWLDVSDFDVATEWDGQGAPARFAHGVLLPTGTDTWDSGDELAGFEDIARFTPPSPIDFTAILKLPASRTPALRPVSAALDMSLAPNNYEMSAKGGTLSINTGKGTYNIEAASGSFSGAGWTKKVAVEDALKGMSHPRLNLDAWREADDGLSDSRFGLDSARVLLWLQETDGSERVLAFSGNPDKPHVLEISNPPLVVKTHAPAD